MISQYVVLKYRGCSDFFVKKKKISLKQLQTLEASNLLLKVCLFIVVFFCNIFL